MNLKGAIAAVVLATIIGSMFGFGLYQINLQHQSWADQLKESRIQVEAMRSAVGTQAEYISVLNSLIGKLKEYDQFGNFTPEQITAPTYNMIVQFVCFRVLRAEYDIIASINSVVFVVVMCMFLCV